jgi:hypothetical protein
LKRLRIPGIVDLFHVDDPKEIKALANDPRVDRRFSTRTCPFNWLLLKRSLSVLSFNGIRFPTMMPKDSAKRAQDQSNLSAALDKQAAAIKSGPAELEPLANWVRGVGPDAQIGMLVQQLVGRLFVSDLIATRESWAAARILVTAPRSSNWPKMLWWFVTGKLRRAKRLLAGMVNNNLSAVNGIGIASHNLVKSFRHMRLLYSDAQLRPTLSGEAAASQCLFAPISLYRQATTAGESGGCPFSRNSLFVLAIGQAAKRDEDHSLVFMDHTWSRCPAASWVPALLEGVWVRALMSTGK